MTDPLRVLFVASEAFPLVKTGGLADVAGRLPVELAQLGQDLRLLLPAYGDVMDTVGDVPEVARIHLDGGDVSLLETRLPGSGLTTWLVAHPSFSGRGGNPYHDEDGNPWADNAERFALLSAVTAAVALDRAGLGWRADVVHGNDWHTGPAMGLVREDPAPPRTVFTIHNLAHLGNFDRDTFERLGFPDHYWHPDCAEFYDQFSFMKAGLSCADVITAVSPGYAREICTSPGGNGMEGLLQHRGADLVGILNGIDQSVWNPQDDPAITRHYGPDSLDAKAANKRALQAEFGLALRDDLPLLGFIGRLTSQKGLDLLLPVLDAILDTPVQLVVLGTGEPGYEQALAARAADRPDALALTLAYDEALAHRIEAGADIFLMPSLFEPCGLNQLYSLRYGTLPVVRSVGGLADTVVDASDGNLAAGTATGFVFQEPEPPALLAAVHRATQLWYDRKSWRRVQQVAMAQDFSWRQSAQHYLALYRGQTD